MQKDVIKLWALPQKDILLSSHLGYLYRVQEESLGANTKQGISLYLILMYPFKMRFNILYCRRGKKNSDSIIFKKSPKIGKIATFLCMVQVSIQIKDVFVLSFHILLVAKFG
jgi:hypothetical protein